MLVLKQKITFLCDRCGGVQTIVTDDGEVNGLRECTKPQCGNPGLVTEIFRMARGEKARGYMKVIERKAVRYHRSGSELIEMNSI